MYLWFIDIQLIRTSFPLMYCCDLLSKCIFDLLIFNIPFWKRCESTVVICFQNVSLIYWYSTGKASGKNVGKVVICFQNVSLIYWYSTNRNNLLADSWLWFAFKMYLWFIDIQLKYVIPSYQKSCDLLSKCIFDLLIFNSSSITSEYISVVICFQNVSLIYWYSTVPSHATNPLRLWFAFKMYLWFIDIQLYTNIYVC